MKFYKMRTLATQQAFLMYHNLLINYKRKVNLLRNICHDDITDQLALIKDLVLPGKIVYICTTIPRVKNKMVQCKK